ncbi:hypothetical protein CEXT_249971 [Caerostris extrusa]|uniref:Uncharacterized protein n=1 Tax=Caerostris extrusa TaxID=172846 RepID=A0AAV4M3S7_CAEEX|nr:hypothetical protein CEXT_249971 [Caerostris extrusa]
MQPLPYRHSNVLVNTLLNHPINNPKTRSGNNPKSVYSVPWKSIKLSDHWINRGCCDSSGMSFAVIKVLLFGCTGLLQIFQFCCWFLIHRFKNEIEKEWLVETNNF